MNKISITLLLLVTLSSTTVAETFVETITQLSARDAVAIYNDQLYASNYNTGEVYTINLDGSFAKVLEANNRGPAGIRIDSSGTLYIALYNQGAIITIDDQGNEGVFAANIREPIALDWDSNNNLYVSHYAGNTSVSRLTPDGTTEAFASISELSDISSLCLDSNDNVYVTSYYSNAIYKVTPSGDVSLFATSDLPGYTFLQYDPANGQLYATVTNTDALVSFDMEGNMTEIINSNNGGLIDGPLASAAVDRSIGLAVSESGKHVYFATNSHIRRLNIADPTVDQVRPYFTSDSAVNTQENSDFSHEFQFVDPNNDPLTLNIENIPDWLQFDGVNKISGTPSANESGQSHSVSVTLTDGYATVSHSMTVTVDAASSPAPSPVMPTLDPITESSDGGSLSYWFSLVLMLFIGVKKFSVDRLCCSTNEK